MSGKAVIKATQASSAQGHSAACCLLQQSLRRASYRNSMVTSAWLEQQQGEPVATAASPGRHRNRAMV